ncbi:hypothetical protein GCM10011345_33600 [Gemmobacter megaterium]|nr:hypothetical protein GCM10011345_33600 [Gemmobacter megaterium]
MIEKGRNILGAIAGGRDDRSARTLAKLCAGHDGRVDQSALDQSLGKRAKPPRGRRRRGMKPCDATHRPGRPAGPGARVRFPVQCTVKAKYRR